MGKTRTRALNVSPAVRKAVYERDSWEGFPCCVTCGKPGRHSIAHFIAKSQGGLAIAENLVNLCHEPCHSTFDHGGPGERQEMEWFIEEYLMKIYPDWDRSKLVYKRA